MVTVTATARLGRAASVALTVAVVWAIAVVVAGFVVPVYRTRSLSSSGEVTSGTDTLVGVNGLGAVFVLGIPLVAAVLVGCALLVRERRGAVPLAWTVTGLLAVFTLLSLMTIGVLVLPVTLALVVACARGARRRVRRPGTTPAAHLPAR